MVLIRRQGRTAGGLGCKRGQIWRGGGTGGCLLAGRLHVSFLCRYFRLDGAHDTDCTKPCLSALIVGSEAAFVCRSDGVLRAGSLSPSLPPSLPLSLSLLPFLPLSHFLSSSPSLSEVAQWGWRTSKPRTNSPNPQVPTEKAYSSAILRRKLQSQLPVPLLCLSRRIRVAICDSSSWILAYYTEFIEETLSLIYCSGEENYLSSVSAVCVWVCQRVGVSTCVRRCVNQYCS